MSHKEAIDFENALDGAGPLKSEVVARWQRKIRDKSQQHAQSVGIRRREILQDRRCGYKDEGNRR